MTASDHLSPIQFYHGTQHPFAAGEMITAPSSRGASSRWNASDPDYSYAATDPVRAWGVAMNLQDAAKEHGPGRVYEVHPTGDMELDPVDNRSWAYRTRQPMRVAREVPEPEIHEAMVAENQRKVAAIRQREAGE